MKRMGVLALATFFTGAAASSGQAQVAPGAQVWEDAGCTSCHGGVGQGGGGGENPAGPNLWRSRLSRDAFKETVACGREKTGMPYHLQGAFTQHACWGRPLGAPPAEAVGGAELTEQQIDTLVAFFMDNVVGKEPITKAKCGMFFANGPANPVCSRYP